jgi:hypothetical protein
MRKNLPTINAREIEPGIPVETSSADGGRQAATLYIYGSLRQRIKYQHGATIQVIIMSATQRIVRWPPAGSVCQFSNLLPLARSK